MKRQRTILAIVVMLLVLSGCSGTYTVASGKADQGQIMFVGAKRMNIDVFVDGEQYDVKTVKNKAYKKGKRIEKTYKNAIDVNSGSHKVEVMVDGECVWSKTVFISAGEHRMIKL